MSELTERESFLLSAARRLMLWKHRDDHGLPGNSSNGELLAYRSLFTALEAYAKDGEPSEGPEIG